MTYIPHNIDINDYDYPLPSERIARYPLPERDASMLLFFDGKDIEKKGFADLPELLDSKDFLVFNNTKVIHARLRFVKSTGAEIEIFCLEPLLPSDYQLSLSSVNMESYGGQSQALEERNAAPNRRHRRQAM